MLTLERSTTTDRKGEKHCGVAVDQIHSVSVANGNTSGSQLHVAPIHKGYIITNADEIAYECRDTRQSKTQTRRINSLNIQCYKVLTQQFHDRPILKIT